MNEKKKLGIVLVFVALVVALIPLTQYLSSEKAKKIMIAYNDLFKEGETNLIVLGREGCTNCTNYIPVLNALREEYKVEYYYVDLAKLNSKQYNEVLEKVELTDETFKGTPHTVVVKDGKKVDELSGYTDQISLYNFLIDAKVIEGEKIEIEVDYKTFKEAYNSPEKKVLVRAASWCHNCATLKSVIASLKKKSEFDIYYMYADLLSSEDNADYATFGSAIESKNCGYPLTIVTQNGQILDSLCGATTEADFKQFLVKNGILEG